MRLYAVGNLEIFNTQQLSANGIKPMLCAVFRQTIKNKTMGRNTDNAPVGHTCPMIDGVLDAINTLYRSSEEMSKSELEYLEKTLEKIRSHNGSLRDWGNELYKEREALEDEVDELKEKVNRLESQVDDYRKEVEELDKQLNEVVSVG